MQCELVWKWLDCTDCARWTAGELHGSDNATSHRIQEGEVGHGGRDDEHTLSRSAAALEQPTKHIKI